MYSPTCGKAEVFRLKALSFGSAASVVAFFVQVSLAVWSVGNGLLSLTWSAYFDDFLSLRESVSAKHAGVCIPMSFFFLGWKLAEDKLMPCHSLCKILGVKLNLKSAKLGTVLVSNTQGRADELTDERAEILLAGKLSNLQTFSF